MNILYIYIKSIKDIFLATANLKSPFSNHILKSQLYTSILDDVIFMIQRMSEIYKTYLYQRSMLNKIELFIFYPLLRLTIMIMRNYLVFWHTTVIQTMRYHCSKLSYFVNENIAFLQNIFSKLMGLNCFNQMDHLCQASPCGS